MKYYNKKLNILHPQKLKVLPRLSKATLGQYHDNWRSKTVALSEAKILNMTKTSVTGDCTGKAKEGDWRLWEGLRSSHKVTDEF